MIKILATAATTALAIGGAGYNYVSGIRSHVVELQGKVETQRQKIEREDAAIDGAIKTLEAAKK